jgi:hypothetical protein
VSSNELCKHINFGGIYSCDTPLSGNFVGLQKIGNCHYIWVELRAYEMTPMTLTELMLSTNEPNLTLANALALSIVYGQNFGNDAVFSATGT